MNENLPKNVFAHPKTGVLWVAKTYMGKRLRESLRTKNTQLAKARAAEKIKLFIDAIENDKWEGLQKTRGKRSFATVGQVLELFDEFAELKGTAHSTKVSYKGKLRRVLEKVGFTNWEGLHTDKLTPAICDRYVELWLIERAKEIKADPRKHQATINMAQSQLRNAASIFSAKACLYYERQRLKLPASIQSFGPSKLYEVKERTYRLPPVELIRKTLEQGYELKGADWLAFVGCFDLACRGDDLANARMDWFVRDGEGNVFLEVPEESTKGTSLHRKPCPAVLYAAIQAEVGGRETILPGDSYDARLSCVQRGSFTAWMAGLGWADQSHKRAHELRKLRACYVYYHGGKNKTGAPVDAKQVLGHSSISTTERSYAGALGVPPELHEWFTYWDAPTSNQESKQA